MIPQRSFAAFLLLSLLTCGIYGIVFFCRWTRENNHLCQGDGWESPGFPAVLLLSTLTLGIYGLYWCWRMGNRLQENAVRYQLQLSTGGGAVLLWMTLGSLCLFGLGFLVGLFLLVHGQNRLAAAYNQYAAALTRPAAQG